VRRLKNVEQNSQGYTPLEKTYAEICNEECFVSLNEFFLLGVNFVLHCFCLLLELDWIEVKSFHLGALIVLFVNLDYDTHSLI
jgi:hypothetical protein